MDEILAILRPDSLGEIIIYVIFFMALLMLFFTPEKNEQANYLTFGIMFCALIDLARGRTGGPIPIEGFDDTGFGTMLIHIYMAIIPFIIAGLVRIRGRKNRAVVPIALVLGVIGMLYAIGTFIAPGTFYAPTL